MITGSGSRLLGCSPHKKIKLGQQNGSDLARTRVSVCFTRRLVSTRHQAVQDFSKKAKPSLEGGVVGPHGHIKKGPTNR